MSTSETCANCKHWKTLGNERGARSYIESLKDLAKDPRFECRRSEIAMKIIEQEMELNHPTGICFFFPNNIEKRGFEHCGQFKQRVVTIVEKTEEVWVWPHKEPVPQCSGGPCNHLRPCDRNLGCSVPEVALPALGFVKKVPA